MSQQELKQSTYIRFPFATRKRDPACFPASHFSRGTVEIIVSVPVFGSFYPATLKPIFLYPIYEILLVRILPVMDDESLESSCCLSLYRILENESQDSDRHFQKQKDRQENGILKNKKTLISFRIFGSRFSADRLRLPGGTCFL